MSKLHSGRCLCGAVTVHATPVANELSACHCSMCRKWGGGPLLGVHCESDVRFDNESNITTYPSSPWAERGFCKTCGTHLFYRTVDRSFYCIPDGLFDNLKDPQFTSQIFIDSKPAYYAFANETHNLTGAEVMKMFEEPEND